MGAKIGKSLNVDAETAPTRNANSTTLSKPAGFDDCWCGTLTFPKMKIIANLTTLNLLYRVYNSEVGDDY
jgi:hypothetical protein